MLGNFEPKKITLKLQYIGKIDYFLPWRLLPFISVSLTVYYKQKSMQWRHWSVHIALRDINKKGVEIGERQNRCHDDPQFKFQQV